MTFVLRAPTILTYFNGHDSWNWHSSSLVTSNSAPYYTLRMVRDVCLQQALGSFNYGELNE